MSSRTLDEVPQQVVNVVVGIAFVFWGVVGIWGIVVALAGGTYPWPFDSWASGGGNILPAVGFFFFGGIATMASALVAWVLIGLPLMLILRVVRPRKN